MFYKLSVEANLEFGHKDFHGLLLYSLSDLEALNLYRLLSLAAVDVVGLGLGMDGCLIDEYIVRYEAI